jgi:hypothetical protein
MFMMHVAAEQRSNGMMASVLAVTSRRMCKKVKTKEYVKMQSSIT